MSKINGMNLKRYNLMEINTKNCRVVDTKGRTGTVVGTWEPKSEWFSPIVLFDGATNPEKLDMEPLYLLEDKNKTLNQIRDEMAEEYALEDFPKSPTETEYDYINPIITHVEVREDTAHHFKKGFDASTAIHQEKIEKLKGEVDHWCARHKLEHDNARMYEQQLAQEKQRAKGLVDSIKDTHNCEAIGYCVVCDALNTYSEGGEG